jgi:hypothetical protein
LRIRRMILPERVLGSPVTNSNNEFLTASEGAQSYTSITPLLLHVMDL